MPARSPSCASEADHWLPQIKGVPIVAVSGLTGEGLDRLMQAVIDAYAIWNKRVVDRRAQSLARRRRSSAHPPPAVSGRRIKLNYITQPKSAAADLRAVLHRAPTPCPDAYRRYLVNGLREVFDLPGTPIRLTLREKENPYAPKK